MFTGKCFIYNNKMIFWYMKVGKDCYESIDNNISFLPVIFTFVVIITYCNCKWNSMLVYLFYNFFKWMYFLSPSLIPTFAYSWQSPYFPRFSYGLCVLQILFFLYGECFKFNLSYICFACFEGLLHWRISMFSPNGFFPFVVTSFWVLIRRTISVQ